jgi:hypothetical protein
MTEPRGTGHERVPPVATRGPRISRRRLLIGGGAVAGVAAAGWYGPAVIDFESHVADVLGISTELAQALTERARESLGDRYELQVAEFVAVTRFPGTELPAAVREEGVRSLLEAMFTTTDAKVAYAGLIPVGDLDRPCPGLGPT